jgi:hypothetical protein
MKQFFARLNPMERRFVVGVGVAFFLVVNVVWVLPLFGQWSATQKANDDAHARLSKFTEGISHKQEVDAAIAKYQGESQVVPPEDQAVQFFRIIQNQAAASGVGIISMGSTRQSLNTNNPYFVEQNQTISTSSGEKQLVDFLYNLGTGAGSLIRVKNLSIQPDAPHQQLTARITLVASYQKKLAGPGTAAAAPAAARTPAPAPPKTPPAATAPKPAAPKPATATPTGAAPKPPPNPAGAPKPQLPGPLHYPATNKPNPLTPNKK